MLHNLKRLVSNIRKYYWYDIDNKFFYIPNTNIKLKITASEALRVISEYVIIGWDAKEIFDRGFWKSDLNESNIKKFIKDYDNGCFDYTIAWICENNIECNNEDKLEYISKIHIFDFKNDDVRYSDGKKRNYWYNRNKRYFYVPDTKIVINIRAGELLKIILHYNLFGTKGIYDRSKWPKELSNATIKKCIDEYVLGLFDDVICWICEENIECKNQKGYDYVFDKELSEILKESDDGPRYDIDKKRIEELSLRLIEANPNGDIYKMMDNHFRIFGINVDPDMLYYALERNLNNIPDNEKLSEKEIKKHNLRELVKFKDKLVYLHNLDDYQMNSLKYGLTRQLINCGCFRRNLSEEAQKIQDKYCDSPFSEKGRYDLSKKDLTIDEILVVFNVMFIFSSDGIHPIWENAITNGTIKNFLIDIEEQLISY